MFAAAIEDVATFVKGTRSLCILKKSHFTVSLDVLLSKNNSRVVETENTRVINVHAIF